MIQDSNQAHITFVTLFPERSLEKVKFERLNCPGLGERPSCIVLVKNTGVKFREQAGLGSSLVFLGEKGRSEPRKDQP